MTFEKRVCILLEEVLEYLQSPTHLTHDSCCGGGTARALLTMPSQPPFPSPHRSTAKAFAASRTTLPPPHEPKKRRGTKEHERGGVKKLDRIVVGALE